MENSLNQSLKNTLIPQIQELRGVMKLEQGSYNLWNSLNLITLKRIKSEEEFRLKKLLFRTLKNNPKYYCSWVKTELVNKSNNVPKFEQVFLGLYNQVMELHQSDKHSEVYQATAPKLYNLNDVCRLLGYSVKEGHLYWELPNKRSLLMKEIG